MHSEEFKSLVADINLWRHLAERLSVYAKHTHWCPFVQDGDCECGLKKLRQELETARWGAD
jgi:hypothetical protein